MKKVLFAIIGTVILFNSSTQAKSSPELAENSGSIIQISKMEVDEDGLLTFTANGEVGCVKYAVEQYIVNRWMVIQHIEGKGNTGVNKYSVHLILNSGLNKIRLKHKKEGDKSFQFTEPIEHTSAKKAVKFTTSENSKVIEFSDFTYFALYNPYGEIVKEGTAKSLDVSEFPKGEYCLVYDNKVLDFEKDKHKIISDAADVKKPTRRVRPVRNPYSRYKIN